MTRPGGARRYRDSQPKPYIRKIGRHWVLSGGWHLGMAGYHSWQDAINEVNRMYRLINNAIDELLEQL